VEGVVGGMGWTRRRAGNRVARHGGVV
jgi:hypothetical protein